MRILFTTERKNEVSTVLNQANFAKLNEVSGVTIDFFRTDYQNFDVVLFMGYDPQIAEARNVKADLKVGVIDPRPGTLERAFGADFIVVNGIEMREWCADHFINIYTYYISSALDLAPRVHTQRTPLVVGYHGNKVHLHTMFPQLTTALEVLAEEVEVEIRAIFDVRNLGKCELNSTGLCRVKIEEIQWSEQALREHLPQIDIGIVPNLIPIADSTGVKKGLRGFPSIFGEHASDFLIRFKATSNAGRIFAFAQCGIPVVVDMYPSALQFVQDGYSGFVAAGAGGWYRALRALAGSAELRSVMGERLRQEYLRRASPDVLNGGLVKFIEELDARREVPEAVRGAERKLSSGEFDSWATHGDATLNSRFRRLLRLGGGAT